MLTFEQGTLINGKYTIQHGYQPTGNIQWLTEGYVPVGQGGENGNTENNPPSPPSGGSAQQDD